MGSISPETWMMSPTSGRTSIKTCSPSPPGPAPSPPAGEPTHPLRGFVAEPPPPAPHTHPPQLAAANQDRLKLMFLLVLVPAVLHAVVRIGLRWSTVDRWTLLRPAAALVVNLTIHADLTSKSLAGADLKDFELQVDTVYLSVVAHLAGCLTDRAWYVYLAIPGYLGYVAVSKALPFLSMLLPKRKGDEPKLTAEEEAKEARRQQRRERRAQKKF